jgi:organic radical activating enzyme
MQNNIISVHNNWPDDVLKLDINLGNICNYKCWYCWPGSNDGDVKWPELAVIKKNITHLINYYQTHTNKKIFDIHFCGGEPTHWPKLLEFVTYLKENFNCLISMTSNGSKKLSWWQKAMPYFDRVHLSCHHEFVNLEKFRELCDTLYDNNVVASASAMMDPRAWDKCMEMVEYLKGSRNRWSIRYVEIIDPTITYTEEQKNIISKHRARRVNPLWFWWNNKYYLNKVTVKDSTGKKFKISDNEILLQKLNNFYGWECTVGVHWLNVSMYGELGGTCGQVPFGKDNHFNLYDPEFTNKFSPNITPAICSKTQCLCSPEINMPKHKLSTTKKVIPIYAD